MFGYPAEMNFSVAKFDKDYLILGKVEFARIYSKDKRDIFLSFYFDNLGNTKYHKPGTPHEVINIKRSDYTKRTIAIIILKFFEKYLTEQIEGENNGSKT